MIKNAETKNLKVIKKPETDLKYEETDRKKEETDQQTENLKLFLETGNRPKKRGNRSTN